MRQAGSGSALDSRSLDGALAAIAALLAADGIRAAVRPIRAIVTLLLGI